MRWDVVPFCLSNVQYFRLSAHQILFHRSDFIQLKNFVFTVASVFLFLSSFTSLSSNFHLSLLFSLSRDYVFFLYRMDDSSARIHNLNTHTHTQQIHKQVSWRTFTLNMQERTQFIDGACVCIGKFSDFS